MTDVWAQARATAAEALTEPWQGRAVALAVETLSGLGLDWDDFRRELMTAIDDEPHRPYYESWLAALERLVAARGGELLSGIDEHRMHAASYRVRDGLDVFPLSLDMDAVATLFDDLGADVDDATRATHVELHRETSGGVASWRVRAFGAATEPVVDIDVGLERWDELRRRYLDLPPDPVDHPAR